MLELNAIITTYGQLETDVRHFMHYACGPFCGRCQALCCRSDYCRESLESPFLAAVRKRFAPEAGWHHALGWLIPTGCSLAAGRPPVCYEFCCRTILAAQPSALARTWLGTLSRILTDAGRNAAGRRHLVELADLQRINTARLTRQLARARSVLDGLREGLNTIAAQ